MFPEGKQLKLHKKVMTWKMTIINVFKEFKILWINTGVKIKKTKNELLMKYEKLLKTLKYN